MQNMQSETSDCPHQSYQAPLANLAPPQDLKEVGRKPMRWNMWSYREGSMCVICPAWLSPVHERWPDSTDLCVLGSRQLSHLLLKAINAKTSSQQKRNSLPSTHTYTLRQQRVVQAYLFIGLAVSGIHDNVFHALPAKPSQRKTCM